MNTDKELNDSNSALELAGWIYLGSDQWIDPQTNTKFPTSVAIKVLIQRKILKHNKR